MEFVKKYLMEVDMCILLTDGEMQKEIDRVLVEWEPGMKLIEKEDIEDMLYWIESENDLEEDR